MDTGDGEQPPKVVSQSTRGLRYQLKHEEVKKFLAPVDMAAEQEADNLLKGIGASI